MCILYESSCSGYIIYSVPENRKQWQSIERAFVPAAKNFNTMYCKQHLLFGVTESCKVPALFHPYLSKTVVTLVLFFSL